MVFQGYALFPHMTVFDNVSYGLRIKSVAKAEIRERTMRALALVGMEQYAQRKPRQLSGGQQQRVAIARTMVMEPRCCCWTNPVQPGREAAARDPRRPQAHPARAVHYLGVRHARPGRGDVPVRPDRADEGRRHRPAVLPREIYNNPANSFAAAFLGNTNFIAATLLSQTPDHTGCEVSATETGQVLKGRSALRFDAQQPVFLSVKHDRVSYTLSHEEFHAARAPGISTMQCRVADVHFLGHVTKVECQAGGQTMTVLRSSACVPPDLPPAPSTLLARGRKPRAVAINRQASRRLRDVIPSTRGKANRQSIWTPTFGGRTGDRCAHPPGIRLLEPVRLHHARVRRPKPTWSRSGVNVRPSAIRSATPWISPKA